MRTKGASLLAVVLLAACVTAPEVPSMSGRWTATVMAPEPARLTLHLEESRGRITGTATLAWWGDIAYLMEVDGAAAYPDVRLRVWNPQAVDWTLPLTFSGPDTLTGEAYGWMVTLRRIMSPPASAPSS